MLPKMFKFTQYARKSPRESKMSLHRDFSQEADYVGEDPGKNLHRITITNQNHES